MPLMKKTFRKLQVLVQMKMNGMEEPRQQRLNMPPKPTPESPPQILLHESIQRAVAKLRPQSAN